MIIKLLLGVLILAVLAVGITMVLLVGHQSEEGTRR